MPKGETPDFSKLNPMKLATSFGAAGDAAASQIKETLGMMYQALERGIVPKQALNIGDDTVEGLYTQAYMLYNQGKYQDAQYLFLALMMLDPKQPKHMLGSAACLHRMGKFEKAAQVYMLITTIDPENPLPHFHAADCYIKLKALPLADMCLKSAIKCCGEKKDFAVVKERALLMLKAVDSEIQALGGFPGIEEQS